jgi:glycosyltransferase involved in cell wall biosynthesis
VDAERFRPAPAPRGDFVIGMGTLYLGKGVDRAIEALATLPEDLRPRLLWTAPITNPRFQAEMEALARRRGVRFEVRQGVPDDELVALLGTARCMLYAPRLEPLGLAPLEANACGTPVAAVAEGGVRETVVDGVNGRLAGDGGPAALGAALASLLRDDPAVWAERCRSHVIARWGWKQAVDALERHLREVAEGAP